MSGSGSASPPPPTRPERPGDQPDATTPPARAEGSDAVELLDGLRPPGGSDALADRLIIEGELGKGGVGVVQLARQVRLRRQVAVKRLPGGPRDRAADLRLLREAWVTAAIDHPAVVPVYDLLFDADGCPVIVLKRIEGTSWRALLREPAQARRRFGEDDALTWHLRVLIQVCGAVQAAHDSGFIHRDIKPENVMIGRHGEPWLVDWGMALSLEPVEGGWLPDVHGSPRLGGTPAYMAPEMTDPDAILDQRTDVYLLGACLYDLLFGRPPHPGTRSADAFHHAAHSVVTIEEGPPPELRALLQRALARNPRLRPPSAAAFQQDLQRFLAHRSSLSLTRDADRQGRGLLAMLQGRGEDIDEGALWQAFGACRFGYRAALDAWPGNRKARSGLNGMVGAVFDWALEHDRLQLAAVALAELEHPPEELRKRLQEARRRHEAWRTHVARLERQAEDTDVNRGRRARMLVGTLLVIGWVAYGPIARLLGVDLDGPLGLLHRDGVELGTVLLLGWIFRHLWIDRGVSRRLMAAVVIAMLGAVVADLFGLLTGTDAATMLALHPLIGALVLGTISVVLDHRFALAAVAYTVALFVGGAFPALASVPHDLARVSLALTLVWIARHGGRPDRLGEEADRDDAGRTGARAFRQ